MIKTIHLDIIQGAIFLCLAVIPILCLSAIGIPAKIITGSCTALYVFIAIAKIRKGPKDKTKKLKERSSDFYDFFNKWYRQQGLLSIYCSDLNWMVYEQFNIVHTICQKGAECTIYLRGDKTNTTIEQTLAASGVRIFHNNKHLTHHRFSLLEYENDAYLIIRDKKNGGEDNEIEFKQEDNKNNPYTIDLVKDLLKSIESESESASGSEKH
jgi:hypothetical protein